MKRIMWGVVLILIIIGGTLWEQKSQKADSVIKPITIGAVLSLSGDAVLDGESIKNGIELAKADLKKSDTEVKIIYQDDKTDPKGTVSAINMLHAQGVDAIIGPTWSFLGDAGVPVADSFKLVTIQPANTSEYVQTNKSPYAFFTSPRVDRAVSPLTEWLKKNKIRRVAIITNEGAWYDTVGKAVSDAAKDAGGEVVEYEKIPFGSDATSLSTLMTKIKTKEPDLLFTEIDDDAGIIAMLKKSQLTNLHMPIMSVTTSIKRVLSTNKDLSLSNKIYVVSQGTSKEFEAKFSTAYGKPSTIYADRAYDSLMLVVDAIKNKKELSLEQYLKEKTNYRGLAGTYAFDANGDIKGGDWIITEVNR